MADLEFRININRIKQKRKKNTNNKWLKCCKTKDCTKSAQGKSDYCIEHGGGNRCESAACVYTKVQRNHTRITKEITKNIIVIVVST